MPWGAVAGAVIGAVANHAAANKANRENIANYQHRYQWQMEDMKKAGLNPIVAGTNGAGSISGANVASPVDFAAAAAQAKALKLQGKEVNTHARQADAQIIASSASAKQMLADARTKDALLPLLVKNQENSNALAAENIANARFEREVIGRQRLALMKAQENQANSAAGLSDSTSYATSHSGGFGLGLGPLSFNTNNSAAFAEQVKGVAEAFGVTPEELLRLFGGGKGSAKSISPVSERIIGALGDNQASLVESGIYD